MSGPQNFVGAHEEGDGHVPHLIVTVLVGDVAEMEFEWETFSPFVDTTSRDGP